MGKLTDAYNKCNPTKRQINKQRKQHNSKLDSKCMCDFLESQWKTTIKYTCECCLLEAYNSEVANVQGYVTDEDLLISSKHKLKPK
jgi:hypothetical protein